MESHRSADVLLVGGGVIGLSLAWELAGQGARVAVVEQGDFGREASWAGAGMLPPGNLAGIKERDPAKFPVARIAVLRAHSAGLWPSWSAALREQTGIDNGYFRCGCVGLLETAGEIPDLEEWRAEGIDVRPLSRAELREVEPALDARLAGGYLLPDFCQVRNPRHLKALIAGCAARGVTLISHTPVVEILRAGSRVTGVRTLTGDLPASQVCIMAGAWSQRVLASAGVSVPVEPIRGQIALLSQQPSPLRRIIEWGPRYLVPRGDGRILVGSTEERAGFDRRATAGAIAMLLDFAQQVVPALGAAQVERCWAGLRPGSPNGVPFLGRAPGLNNLLLATGHFRNGLQMSPGTAVLMRQLLLNQPTDLPLERYAPHG